jgi:hypothetical protein
LVENDTLFIGLSSFRDASRCGRTIYTAFNEASNPDRVFIGVVDQRDAGTEKPCVEEYCLLVNDGAESGPCPRKDQVSTIDMDWLDSRGPTLARSRQQSLVQDEDFCLQVDAHSVFLKDWDKNIITNWLEASNEMAVLTTYINAYDSATTYSSDQIPHLCEVVRGGHGMVRNAGAASVAKPQQPLLEPGLWGAGLSFSKCHSERNVKIDPYTPWIFDGEEFTRAARLWTHGYDTYSPSKVVVLHDYSKVPHRFEKAAQDKTQQNRESAASFLPSSLPSFLPSFLSCSFVRSFLPSFSFLSSFLPSSKFHLPSFL